MKRIGITALSLEDAATRVGAGQDEFWSRASSHLDPKKAEQQARFDALKPELVEACGP